MHHINDIFLTSPAGSWYVYLLVFFVALFESTPIIGTFTPGVLLLIFFGLVSSQGQISLIPTVGLSIAGGFLGDCAAYYAGKYGHRFLKAHKGLLSIEHLSAGKEFFEEHGGKSLIFGRFIGLIRPILPLLAGVMKIPTPRFLALDALGVALWSAIYIMLGYFFGSQRGLVHHVLRVVGIGGAILLAVAVFLFYFLRKVDKVEKDADVDAIIDADESSEGLSPEK